MPKMKVQCKCLNFNDRVYRTGDVFETTDDEAYSLIKDGNAVPVSDSELAVDGERKAVDPVEAAIIDRKFEELRESGVIQMPPGAATLSAPVPGPAAFLVGSERLPADAIVEATRYEG